jgi:hypothetical protein
MRRGLTVGAIGQTAFVDNQRWWLWLPALRPGRQPLERSAPRRLPDAAAPVAGNDSAPAPSPRATDEPTASAGQRQADGYRDGHGPAPADTTPDLASSSGKNPSSGHGKGGAVGGAAIAPQGGENHVPGAVIGSRPSRGVGGAGHGHRSHDSRGQYPAQRAPAGKSGNRSTRKGHFLPYLDWGVHGIR